MTLIRTAALAAISIMAFEWAASAAHSGRTVSIGYSATLGSILQTKTVTNPPASDPGFIVGIAIAGSDDHAYIWYADGKVSSGTSTNFTQYRGKQTFTLPEDKQTLDIVAMGIRVSNDRVVTWYADGTYSEGTSRDLDKYSGTPKPFTIPGGRPVTDIVGIAIAKNDTVYAWYADGKVSQGTPGNLGSKKAPYAYAVPGNKKIGHIIDMGITGSTNRVYTWYHDVEAGSAHNKIASVVDARAMSVLRRFQLPGVGVTVAKNQRIVLEKGYGFTNLGNGTRMAANSRCRIGSVSKVFTAAGALHLDQTRNDFSVEGKVYGPGGALSDSSYINAQNVGTSRFQPIVAKAIASNDRTYTWYHDRTVSSGTSNDPDKFTARKTYTIPDNLKPEDIRAIAISPNDWVWVWYDDGTFSAGTSTHLGSRIPRDKEKKVSLPKNYNGRSGGYGMSHIVGVAIAPNDRVYVWYDDGRQSAGTREDFDAHIAPRAYQPASGQQRYGIVGMGIRKSNSRVYTWYSTGKVSQGTSQDLDATKKAYAYQIPNAALDGTKNWSNWYAAMKVNHLMSHASGLDGSGDVEGTVAMFTTAPDNLNYEKAHKYNLRTRRLRFEPGKAEKYSNHGAGTVGHIIATVSGKTYRQYLRSNIIDPLGLNIRSFSEGQKSVDMYRHKYVNGVPQPYVDDQTNDLGLAAGGWKSSTGDLVRFGLALDGHGLHPDILNATFVQKMHSRPYPGKSSFAHGWDKSSKGKLAHSGGMGGALTHLGMYPGDHFDGNTAPIVVAVCTNISIASGRGGGTVLVRLANDIAQAAARASIPTNYDLH